MIQEMRSSRMERREVIVTVCLLVVAAADTTRSVTVPSVTEVCGDPRIAHSHVAVSTDAPVDAGQALGPGASPSARPSSVQLDIAKQYRCPGGIAATVFTYVCACACFLCGLL